jgi:hypothetical protein
MEGRIALEKEYFTEKERTVLDLGELKAVAFAFDTGVHAVRIENSKGHIVVLPFQGQQVWDAVFRGRSLKMKNFFDKPVLSSDLLDSYGAFQFHCGALRMGCPGPEDHHPLHGELPAARYQEAWLKFGVDEGGSYLGVSGNYAYTKAFGDKYKATPSAVLHEAGTILDLGMTIENLSHSPMDLMYMCHVNFLPAEYGEIVQATGWSPEDMAIRSSIPAHVKPTPQFLAFLASLSADPGVTRVMKPEDSYSPEVVFYIKNLKKDRNGCTHMLQKHVDGTADYISYDLSVLDHTVRWILKHEDQRVMGMALPATCDPEGYTAEKKKGNLRSIPGLGKVSFRVKAGYLDEAETKQIERLIRSL